jgi:uncharacterized OB-fold protein
MPFCTHCGREFPVTRNICLNCGRKYISDEPTVGQFNGEVTILSYPSSNIHVTKTKAIKEAKASRA